MALGRFERGALATIGVALACGLAWYAFVTTPLPRQWSLREALLLGLAGGAIVGVLARAASLSLTPVAAGAGLGIILGSSLAQWRVSDVTMSAWQTLWAGLTQLLAYQFAVWMAIIASWIAIHTFLLARRRGRVS